MSTIIFGAICPKEGKGAALVLPWYGIEAMALHTWQPSRRTSHRAGMQPSCSLRPDGTSRPSSWCRDTAANASRFGDITIVPPPAKCPKLNPQENVWQFMRDNRLSDRVFTFYDNLVDHCCAAWNKLTDAPWTITSLGLRDWTYEF